MASHKAKIPSTVREYMERVAEPEHPTIAEVYFPRRGWVHVDGRRRISGNKVRTLRREGALFVSLRIGSHQTDFALSELS